MITEVSDIRRFEKIFPLDMQMKIDLTNVEEIWISRNSKPVVLGKSGKRFIDFYISNEVFDSIINGLCKGSYHTHCSTINKGYINAGEGIRVGVCGRAITEGDRILNVNNIDSITIRIPKLIRGISDNFFRLINEKEEIPSILFYSPPGVGKTTLLRDIIMKLTDDPYYKKLCILDTAEELYINEMGTLPFLNVYRGYTKQAAFEASVRTMAPEVIITDEIASVYESDQILKYQNSGVSIIATAHASSFEELIQRPFIKPLYNNKCFDIYCGIHRRKGSDGCSFALHKYGELIEC